MDAASADSAQTKIAATLDGSQVIELRLVDKTLFLRADVQKLASAAGQTDRIQALQQQAAQMPAWLQAALGGKWVSLPTDTAKSLAGQLGASTAATPNTAQAKKALDELQAALERDVTVTRASDGGDKGDHLILKGDARKLVNDLIQVGGSVASVPGLPTAAPTSVPEKTLTLDAWVKDGELRQLSFDLVQLAEGADAQKLQGKHVPLTLLFESKADSIDKPGDAVPIDLSQILPLLGSLGGGAA